MAPPFWLRCNICTSAFTKNKTLFLLSCSHLFCQSCCKHFTDGSKKCPICKISANFKNVMKLPDTMKVFFKPVSLAKPAQIMDFQRKHQKRLVKLASEYKVKTAKIKAKIEKEDLEIKKMLTAYEKLVSRRKQMQEKLYKIYLANQKRKPEMMYRDSRENTMSTSVSHISNHSSLSHSRTFINPNSSMTKGKSGSSFFNEDAPMLQSQSKRVNKQCNFFQNSSLPSQSSRKPFFA